MNPNAKLIPAGEARKEWAVALRDKYPIHPAAGRFPMMDEEDLAALAADIAENGQNQEIIIFEGRILDGRNRFEACLMNGIEPRFREFNLSADQVDTFVLSENFQRRHLTSDQKEELVVTLRREDFTQKKIAQMLRMSEETVNAIIKDKLQEKFTKTRTDSLGRQRPTRYQRKEKVETEAEKIKRLEADATSDFRDWCEKYFSDLGEDRLDGIVDAVLNEIAGNKHKSKGKK